MQPAGPAAGPVTTFDAVVVKKEVDDSDHYHHHHHYHHQSPDTADKDVLSPPHSALAALTDW